MKTRFAKFFNLPELMRTFHEVADIQTADMLNLPTPKVNFHVEINKPSELQKEMVESLAQRAELVRNKDVKPEVDNMLLITNDGRKLALDQRIINPLLPDFEGSKVNQCVKNVFDIWERTAENRSTQLVFCDLSTPKKGDNEFSIYTDIRDKLLAKGIPQDEVAFVHSAKNERQKKELFGKVRSGKIRVLIGSTSKMGAGTNVQDKLIALHDLDCPWRPRDLEQRLGRGKRRGNMNAEIDVFRYITEETFDAYLFQMLERKQRYISQVFSSKEPLRVMEEIDGTALSYAEIKALATGDPRIMEHCTLMTDVEKLKVLRAAHKNNIYRLEDDVANSYPNRIAAIEQSIKDYSADMQTAANNTPADKEQFLIVIDRQNITDKKQAGSMILEECKALKTTDEKQFGSYRGFDIAISFNATNKQHLMTLQGKQDYKLELGADIFGNITRLDNAIDRLKVSLEYEENLLSETKSQLETAKAQAAEKFPREDEFQEKSARLAGLTLELKLNKADKEILDETPTEVKKVVSMPQKTSRIAAGAR